MGLEIRSVDKRMTKYAISLYELSSKLCVGTVVITKILEHILFSSGAAWLETWPAHVSKKKTRALSSELSREYFMELSLGFDFFNREWVVN